MEDDPVVLNEEERVDEGKLFRQSDKKFNISDRTFRFKNVTDWNSLYSLYERNDR